MGSNNQPVTPDRALCARDPGSVVMRLPFSLSGLASKEAAQTLSPAVHNLK